MKRSIRDIKAKARRALSGHFGLVILGMLLIYGLNALGSMLASALFGGDSTLDLVLSEIFLLIVSLIVGIVSAGYSYMLLNIARGRECSMGDLVWFFKNQPDRVIVAGFILALIQVVTAIPYYYVSYTMDMGETLEEMLSWMTTAMGFMLLSVVLNFLVSLPFAMTYYLMADDTELGGIKALKASVQMMKGNLGRYLLLNLSFLPLMFLSVFTFYIALLWIIPYMNMAVTIFYQDVNKELDHALPRKDGYYSGGYGHGDGGMERREDDFNSEA